MAVMRIPMIPVLFGILALSFAEGASAARDTRIQKQDRTRQMRVLVGDLDRLSSLSDTDLKNEAVKKRTEATIDGLVATYDLVAVKLKPVRQQKIRAQTEDLVKTFRAAPTAKVLAAKAKALRKELLDALKVNTAPVITPTFQTGAVVYKEHCATCHGTNGNPPEVLAKKLHPPPTDLARAPGLASVSPFRIYNDLIVGVPNTAKKPYADLLADEELWSVAFYSMALRHIPGGNPTNFNFDKVCKAWPDASRPNERALQKLSLADVSTTTDADLLRDFAGNEQMLAYVRLCLPFGGSLRR